ncbi:hypothetical protein SLA2020_338800 [Shorea laevis]
MVTGSESLKRDLPEETNVMVDSSKTNGAGLSETKRRRPQMRWCERKEAAVLSRSNVTGIGGSMRCQGRRLATTRGMMPINN